MAASPNLRYRLNRADICQIESEITELPDGRNLYSYHRYYAGRVEGKSYIVTGVFVNSHEAGVTIVLYEQLPLIFDGGCDVITVKYNLVEKRVVSMRCNGDA